VGIEDISEAASPWDGGAQPIGANGEPCCKANELACADHAQKLVLICEPKSLTWGVATVCSGNLLCDTTVGGKQGSCQEPVGLCIGKQPGAKVCDGLKSVQCGPDLVTSTETTCQYACVAGECTGVCAPGSKQCSGNLLQTCSASGQWDAGTACTSPTPVCSAGQCIAASTAGPSCTGLAATCGASGTDSCCASSVVTGGVYNRSNNATYPATVSDFRMDKYEITVGRFRKFVAGYPGNKPVAGAGKNPNNAADPGWDVAWNGATYMPADAATLTGTSGVQCDAPYQTWTPTALSNESRPINCIRWYEAFAFCIWDGGRLPTEAEWNYAAAGGGLADGQRQYPWSVPASSTTIDATYAVYSGAGSTANVGSKSPKGDDKWLQSDLAGNVWEWNLDWYASAYPTPRTNCANLTAASPRVLRGGGFGNAASPLLSSIRNNRTPASRDNNGGARCVRSAP
jgi:sulfatase modifying factor 1